RLKEMNLKNPFVIGFGIANNASFSQACAYGAGAVVGSAFINVLRESKNLEEDIPRSVNSLKDGKVVRDDRTDKTKDIGRTGRRDSGPNVRYKTTQQVTGDD